MGEQVRGKLQVSLEEGIKAAASACPVEVIKFE